MSFIDVPNVPGVPPLSSYSPNNVVLLVADAIASLIGFFLPPQWGIYLNGFPVLSYDNQPSFGYKQDWAIAHYPVEQGAFQSYDKVQLPAEIRCRFSTGGSVFNRQQMLASIDAVMSTTQVYDVVTPEKTYLSFNFSHRDYEREAENVGLITIDVWLIEIIQTATAQFQSTSTPVVAGQQGLGNVSAVTPSQTMQSAVTGNFD